ncbi:MAG: hypothetical protein KatS3mg111_1101 [Pirellulaceae bacterium]|nr:MAG: hypothetical protein KatS3mg111_1101 [Pirellulaceae bacterium]
MDANRSHCPTDWLLVMARFPAAGKCKTRLIPALGADGAARLHGQLTEHTLRWCRQVRDRIGAQVQVWVSGASGDQMAARFGADLDYRRQPTGDLGQRMRHASQVAIESGAERIVIVGTDCPQLDAATIAQVFSTLDNHRVCLIPATDGGYVLLGFCPEGSAIVSTVTTDRSRTPPTWIDALFKDIAWGSSQVLAQTIAQLRRRESIPLGIFPPRRDVDLPEDLDVWYQRQESQLRKRPRFSVIVPVGGREEHLDSCLATVRRQSREAEILVTSASFSTDTCDAAMKHQAYYLVNAVPRGARINAALRVATGKFVVLLHADTLLPDQWPAWVEQLAGQNEVALGAFPLRIDSPRLVARWIERAVAWRSAVRKLPYGDQAIFARRTLLRRLGGVQPWPIMEDYELVRRAGRWGKIVLAEDPVLTSARRWHHRGFLATTLLNQLIILGYHCGISPTRLASWYRHGLWH